MSLFLRSFSASSIVCIAYAIAGCKFLLFRGDDCVDLHGGLVIPFVMMFVLALYMNRTLFDGIWTCWDNGCTVR